MNEEKFESILKIIEIIAIALAAVLLIVFKFIPEFKKTLGSSDTYVDIDNYDTIVEVNILSGPNFFLITSGNKLTNILFANQESCLLYNKDIENNDISTAMSKIISKFSSSSLINETTQIQLTAYPKNKNYQKIKDSITSNISFVNITEVTSSLVDRVKLLQLSSTTEQQALQELQLYSMDIVQTCSNDNKNSISISKSNAKNYAEEIYLKLQKYGTKYPNQPIDSTTFPIQLIPVQTNDVTIYPSSNSWYYIENGNVYAYIAFFDNSNYSFCYQGSIENIKEGECP